MQLTHQTLRDPEAVHQVVFTHGDNSRKMTISCNCRRRPGDHSKAGKLNYDPMGKSANLDESRELYNNPENHWAPFDPDKDKAKW